MVSRRGGGSGWDTPIELIWCLKAASLKHWVNHCVSGWKPPACTAVCCLLTWRRAQLRGRTHRSSMSTVQLKFTKIGDIWSCWDQKIMEIIGLGYTGEGIKRVWLSGRNSNKSLVCFGLQVSRAPSALRDELFVFSEQTLMKSFNYRHTTWVKQPVYSELRGWKCWCLLAPPSLQRGIWGPK